jgi:hypothetical protein
VSAPGVVIDIVAMGALTALWMLVLHVAARRFGVPGARRGWI